MTRSLTLALLAVLAGGGGLTAAEIYYLNPITRTEEHLRGATITDEGPQGITVQAAGKPAFKISPLNVRHISYDEKEVPDVDYRTIYRKPFAKIDTAFASPKEDVKLDGYRKAFPELKELIPKLKTKKLRRHAEFCLAEAALRLAPTDPKMQDEALALLTKFRQDHPDGWQFVPCLKALAELQEAKGDTMAVQKTYEDLGNVPGLPADVKQDAQYSAARALMRTENYAAAETKLAGLERSLAADSPLKVRVQVNLAQCQTLSSDATKGAQGEKALRDMVSKTTDPLLKALAHNTLGDYYQKKGQDEQAFWNYLRVDTLYSEDKNEHARALYHLATLFRTVKKDANRAEDCLKLLKENEKFSGTEYQKKAQAMK